MDRSRKEVTFLNIQDEGLDAGAHYSGFHIFSVGPYIYIYIMRINDESTRDENRERCTPVILDIYWSIIVHLEI